MGDKEFVYMMLQVGVDDNGVIQKMHIDYYQDDGATKNDSIAGYTLHYLSNLYDDSTWSVNGYGVKTDLPSQTWCRSPGSTEAISAIETIMEHIAQALKKDPTEIKLANKRQVDSPLPALVDDLKRSADYEKRVRDIQQFNQTNRWKKRGISLVPMDYPFSYFGNYHSMVSVYGGDGTVSISHGCIEMGQGLNTKVAQVCAYILGIDVEDVSVKPYYSLISPNVAPTGGSSGSESAAYVLIHPAQVSCIPYSNILLSLLSLDNVHALLPGPLYPIAAQRLRHNLRSLLANLGRNHPTRTCPLEFLKQLAIVFASTDRLRAPNSNL
ncbi:hypothetical protein J6590_071593 [Homalodisca vitripennis]|nr:hypothetical protein J6590_071593 [Homalodisca vitripennis]